MAELRVALGSVLSGRIRVPGDKSISHRALLVGALARGTTRVHGLLDAGDTESTAACLRALGVTVSSLNRDPVRVEGRGLGGLSAPAVILDAGNSGTTMRLLAGILAAHDFSTTLTGDDSLQRRPMDRVAEPLRRMGAEVSGRGPRCQPPIRLRGGRLSAIEHRSPVASAQVKSAVLLAGLHAAGETRVIEPAPSRDHTERMLRAFGADIQTEGPVVRVRGGAQLIATEIRVPGDISAAAFLLVAAAITPGARVTVENVGLNPTRTGALDVLAAMGAVVEVSPAADTGEPTGAVTVEHRSLRGVSIGGSDIPRLLDELPALSIAASVAEGATEIRDAAELRVKESDRLAAIARELSRLGAAVEERPDGLRIAGGARLRGGVCESGGDHRMAMALAVAGLAAAAGVSVRGAECINTSFPGFVDALRSLGAEVEIEAGGADAG